MRLFGMAAVMAALVSGSFHSAEAREFYKAELTVQLSYTNAYSGRVSFTPEKGLVRFSDDGEFCELELAAGRIPCKPDIIARSLQMAEGLVYLAAPEALKLINFLLDQGGYGHLKTKLRPNWGASGMHMTTTSWMRFSPTRNQIHTDVVTESLHLSLEFGTIERIK